jgi:hypothetical protein
MDSVEYFINAVKYLHKQEPFPNETRIFINLDDHIPRINESHIKSGLIKKILVMSRPDTDVLIDN